METNWCNICHHHKSHFSMWLDCLVQSQCSFFSLWLPFPSCLNWHLDLGIKLLNGFHILFEFVEAEIFCLNWFEICSTSLFKFKFLVQICFSLSCFAFWVLSLNLKNARGAVLLNQLLQCLNPLSMSSLNMTMTLMTSQLWTIKLILIWLPTLTLSCLLNHWWPIFSNHFKPSKSESSKTKWKAVKGRLVFVPILAAFQSWAFSDSSKQVFWHHLCNNETVAESILSMVKLADADLRFCTHFGFWCEWWWWVLETHKKNIPHSCWTRCLRILQLVCVLSMLVQQKSHRQSLAGGNVWFSLNFVSHPWQFFTEEIGFAGNVSFIALFHGTESVSPLQPSVFKDENLHSIHAFTSWGIFIWHSDFFPQWSWQAQLLSWVACLVTFFLEGNLSKLMTGLPCTSWQCIPSEACSLPHLCKVSSRPTSRQPRLHKDTNFSVWSFFLWLTKSPIALIRSTPDEHFPGVNSMISNPEVVSSLVCCR